MPASPAPYALTLFGNIDLHGPNADAPKLLVQSKVVALFAYFCIPSVGRFVRRDTLVGLLWPELDQARARKALRQSVHAMRSALGADALPGRGDEEIALSPELVWCDVAAFIHSADAGLLMQALQLYRGDLMPGFHLPECGDFDRWLEEERATANDSLVLFAGATEWSTPFAAIDTLWSREHATARGMKIGFLAGALAVTGAGLWLQSALCETPGGCYANAATPVLFGVLIGGFGGVLIGAGVGSAVWHWRRTYP